MSRGASANERDGTLKQRIGALEICLAEYKKKSVIVAILAALPGLIGVWASIRSQQAETHLKTVQAELAKADLKYREDEKRLNRDRLELENRLRAVELTHKEHEDNTGEMDRNFKVHNEKIASLKNEVALANQYGFPSRVPFLVNAMFEEHQRYRSALQPQVPIFRKQVSELLTSQSNK